MNKKSRRLSKLISRLNDHINLIVNEDITVGDIKQQKEEIEMLLKIINFELSYLELKKYGSKN